VFGAVGGALASLFVAGPARAETWFARRTREKMRDPEYAAAYQAEVIRAGSGKGLHTQLFYEGREEGRAVAACPAEGWFERFAPEDDFARPVFLANGAGPIDRGRRGGIKVRAGQLVTERIYGAFSLRDRLTGVVTHSIP